MSDNVTDITQAKGPPESEIITFFHCRMCIDEKPENVSPQEWSLNECGWTERGFQVWCRRHNINVMHIDFEGDKHPADMGIKGDFE